MNSCCCNQWYLWSEKEERERRKARSARVVGARRRKSGSDSSTPCETPSEPTDFFHFLLDQLASFLTFTNSTQSRPWIKMLINLSISIQESNLSLKWGRKGDLARVTSSHSCPYFWPEVACSQWIPLSTLFSSSSINFPTGQYTHIDVKEVALEEVNACRSSEMSGWWWWWYFWSWMKLGMKMGKKDSAWRWLEWYEWNRSMRMFSRTFGEGRRGKKWKRKDCWVAWRRRRRRMTCFFRDCYEKNALSRKDCSR